MNGNNYRNSDAIFYKFIWEAHHVPLASEGFQKRWPIVSIRINPKTKHFNDFSRLFHFAGGGPGLVRP
jgi:hypothetical protein